MNIQIKSCYLRSNNRRLYAGHRSRVKIRSNSYIKILEIGPTVPKIYYIVDKTLIVYYIHSGNQYYVVIDDE